MGRLLSGLVVAVLLAAAPAQAEPVALLDAPRAHDVAIAGDQIVVGRRAARQGVRVDAVPLAGGPARRLLSLPGPDADSLVAVAATPAIVAAVVGIEREDDLDFRLYSGPPTGPLALRLRVRLTDSLRLWLPVGVDADADRLLVHELRFRPVGLRARVLVPDAPAEPVPWGGAMLEGALSGERVAFMGSRSRTAGAKVDHLYVVDRRTGAVQASAKLRSDEDIRDAEVDLAADGRAVAALDGRLLTVAPGVAPARMAGDFAAPRFSGDGLAALQGGRFDTQTPVLLAPGTVPRALGFPSADVEAFEADHRGAAWIANGCVLYAPRDGAPPAEPPAGPCPRAEVVHEEGDQVLRGRRLQVVITCIAAPAGGCRGTALLGGGRYGRGAFTVPAGTRRTIAVRLTNRGMRHVRRMRERFHDAPFFALSARVQDGRAHGTGGVVVDRVRGR